MKIIWARDATLQLAGVHAYIAEDNREAADRIVVVIRDAVRILAFHPFAGREGRVKNTRELVISGMPYVVAYRFSRPDTIEVLAVLHGKQRWPSTF